MAMENTREVLQKVRESLEFWYLRILSPVSSHNFVKVNSFFFFFSFNLLLTDESDESFNPGSGGEDQDLKEE